MDESYQDFADICSKLLKRVRRKAGDPGCRIAESQSSSRSSKATSDPSKKTSKKKDVESDSKSSQAKPSTTRRPDLVVLGENAVPDSGDGGVARRSSKATSDPSKKTSKKKDVESDSKSSQAKPSTTRRPDLVAVGENAVPDSGDGGPPGPGGSGEARDMVEGSQHCAKDKVLQRMQQFKRASPHMLVHNAVPKEPKTKAAPQPEPGPSDAALALQLQQDLNRRVTEALEERGLVFCQLCQRDLSHMTPEGRTQHLNRCLDKTEVSPASASPPPPPHVADCPICGKRFKSQKSRASHLKRCSAEMGVAPAVLLQCVQRQAAEGHGDGGSPPRAADARGSKRKEPAAPGLPARKRPRKKAPPLDEQTMVALALSSSLLEREMELEREAAAALASVAPLLQWRQDAGKGRRKAGKRRKGGPPSPTPLLLVQDPEAAQARVQERVAALLLRERCPSPPTPPLSPSRLRAAPACPLWRQSALENGDPCSADRFYTPELRDLLVPGEPPQMATASVLQEHGRSSSVPSAVKTDAQIASSGSPAPHPPSPGRTSPTPSPSLGSQVLRDVMELAEEGRTLSQWIRDEAGSTAVPLSGFIPEEGEEQPCSGFLPPDDLSSSQPIRSSAGTPGVRPESGGCEAVALSRLSSDLSSMVNNPQLSDVQLQVDSGEVYSVHSFMLYARCPLLAQMVHDSGFGVQEEGLPGAQRVLLGDTRGEAVLALLQYLYTGRCPRPPTALLPALLELATRFDLEELQRLCQFYWEAADAGPQEEAADAGQPWDNHHHHHHSIPEPDPEPERGDQDFKLLLQSMWSDEEEEEYEGERGEGAEAGMSDEAAARREDRRLASGDAETSEERVNDDEMEEIYEFAATQRRLAEERDSTEEGGGATHEEEEEEEEEETGEATSAEDNAFTLAGSPEPQPNPVSVKADVPEVPSSLGYSRLFSGSWGVGEELPASPQPSTSRGPQGTPTARPERRSPGGGVSLRGDRTTTTDGTCLQSSPSEIIDLSLSPGAGVPGTPVLPLPGLSPGEHDVALDADPGGGHRGNLTTRMPPEDGSPGPRGPAPPGREAEFELIVLSDSSEEPAASPGPSPPLSPVYTQIKPPPSQPSPPRPRPSPSPPVSEAEEGGGPDQRGFSPEVSWLFSATPPQDGRSVCTQTQSSMRRTQLFPRAGGSGGDRSPPTDGPPPEGSLNRASVGVTSSLPAHSTRRQPPAGSAHLLLSTSVTSTPAHARPGPYSSTPLHQGPPAPPVPPETPPGSGPLSPSGGGSGRVLGSGCSGRRGNSAASESVSGEEGKRGPHVAGGEKRGMEPEAGRERGAAEPGLYPSFTNDEPPMAFNDSWGLDAGGGADGGQALCFSLRLDDSPQRSPTPPHSLHPPPPPPGHSPGPEQITSASRRPAASLTAARSLADPDTPPGGPEVNSSLLDPQLWDSWQEEEEEVFPPSQRGKPAASAFQTPVSSGSRKRTCLVPITPMPSYSDMDTPELKNKLNRFGVRPLPKGQMILKLREIHQYTHQLVLSSSSDEEEKEKGVAPLSGPGQAQVPPPAPGARPLSVATGAPFKRPRAPEGTSSGDRNEEEDEPLSSSQGSSTSSIAASDDSQGTNPELPHSSDSESDGEGAVTASQAASRQQDRLLAARAFILSDAELYGQVIRYQPLVLSELQARLKAAGVRLGASKLLDFLDSQCITVTTAKPGVPRRKAKARVRGGAKPAAGRGARGRKRKTAAAAE